MVSTLVKNHEVTLGGITIIVEEANLLKCDQCTEVNVHAKELKRWRKLVGKVLTG